MARAKFGSAKQVNDTELDQNDLFADDSEQRQELKTLTLRLDTESWKALKMLSLELERPVTKVMREALNEFFVKHGKAPGISE